MLGVGMAGLLHFLPADPVYRKDNLAITAELANPVTAEIRDAVRNGYVFRGEYAFSLIVNDRKSYEASRVNRLSRDSVWRVNGAPVPEDSLGSRMGAAAADFPRLRFDAGDRILVFIKAKIPDDSAFTASTALPAAILWNYYVPRTRTEWEFRAGGFRAR